MSKNTNLLKARKEKNDEFYTQLSDIEKEMQHYKEYFIGKNVLCNCDDYTYSNFYKYFSDNFDSLQLCSLTTVCYNKEGKGVCKVSGLDARILEGDWDFRSQECIEILKGADIVVTNPPFSLFREYLGQLMEYGKKFIIVGSCNAITYKETFRLIRDNNIWLGNSSPKMFIKPDKTTQTFGNICWFTNLQHKKRNEEIILYKKYNAEDYPKYDNYEAINVDKVKDIPMDWKGVMGVPITFLDKYNPEQFEILGLANSARWIGYECFTIIKGVKLYNRILIKNRKLFY